MQIFAASSASRFARASVAAAAVVTALGRGAHAQTFVQLTDLGQGIGARLTRSVANQRLGVALFGEIGTKVSFIDNGVVYQFASDPAWGRILSGRMNYWVHEYDNRAGPGGRLRQPLGIDVSARKYLYAADRANGVVFLAEFSPAAQNLVNPGVWTSAQFPRPVAVAWDGRTTPLTVRPRRLLEPGDLLGSADLIVVVRDRGHRGGPVLKAFGHLRGQERGFHRRYAVHHVLLRRRPWESKGGVVESWVERSDLDGDDLARNVGSDRLRC